MSARRPLLPSVPTKDWQALVNVASNGSPSSCVCTFFCISKRHHTKKTVATAPRGQVHSAHETPTVCLDMLQHVGTRRGGVGEEKGEEGTLRLLPVTIQAQIDASAVTAARAAPARAGEHTQGNGAGTSACKWCNLPGRSGGQLGIAAARPRRQKLAAVLLGHRIFVLARFPPLRSQQMLSGLDEATPHELTSQSSAETFIGDLLPSTTGARFRR
mmetsp:Transcript_14928/g.52407  ORF Transcript_14928/g.52407 Transcript_14928/m.52407 type:complete len:215 (+) Transcript_14928:429-1073(+)